VGIVLAFFGGIIAARAYASERLLVVIHWRPLIVVTASIAAFAATVERVGMVPAIVLSTLIASVSDGKFEPVRATAYALVLSAMAYLIFRLGLGIPLPPFRRSF
jgi:hypothetical protein